MLRRFILKLTLVTVAALAAAACSPAPEADEAATGGVDATDQASGQSGPDETALPQEGQRYWLARQQLTNQGYVPMTLGDGEPFAVCVAEMETGEPIDGECPGDWMVLPEVESCAGTGAANCRTNWIHQDTGRHLIVFTIGEPQPGVVSGIEWGDAPARTALSTEDACRQIIERQFGQAGPAVTFIGGEISWRAPVDGGRMQFACAVDGDQVSLTREGQTQTYSLNETADETAQEEAR